MQDFLKNYDKNYEISIRFIKKQFSNAHFTNSDYEDIVSTAVLKILTSSNLSPTLSTLLYVSNFSAIDLFRKRCKETLVSDFPTNTSLNILENDDIATKNLIELVVDEVGRLNPRRRNLMELKYHAYSFAATTSNDEMMKVKNQAPINCEQLARQLNYPSAIALRQETFRAVAQLRTRLAA